jgi:hypothetical protein
MGIERWVRRYMYVCMYVYIYIYIIYIYASGQKMEFRTQSSISCPLASSQLTCMTYLMLYVQS